MFNFKPMVLGLAFSLLVLAAPAVLAQTSWSVEGTNPSYAEYNAPDPNCVNFPPPYVKYLPPVHPPNCPPFNTFPTGDCRVGGSAFDDDGNTFFAGPAMLHTDGISVEMTDPATGNFITAIPIVGVVFPVGTFISGLGYDSRNDIVWVTEGTWCAGVGLSNCAPPPVHFPPFMLPLPIPGVPASGLDYDPCTKSLWFCDCAGNVVQSDLSGKGLFKFSTSNYLTPEQTGLDVNVTNGNLQVTDGSLVAEFRQTGVLAPTGPFYLKSNPYAIPLWAGAVNGIGFSLRPQKYGKGCSLGAGPPPSIGWKGGHPYAGNPTFTVFETGAIPGADVYLFYGFKEACPGLPIGGCPGGSLWIFPFKLIYLGKVSAAGDFSLPVPLPASLKPCGFPVGLPLMLQFANVVSKSPLKMELSDALSFTIGER